MSVTMRDVALLAGVSNKTVSNVVNDHPHVHPTTRARVQQAIADLGYRPNLSARGLRSGRTGVIGLAVPELRQPYFAELADAVIAAAERRHLSVIIGQAGADREHEMAVLTRGLRQTDGLLFSPEHLGTEDRGLLGDVEYPLVLLGERIFGGPSDHVTMHNVEGARAAVEHLLGLGRRRIAVVGAHPDRRTGQLRPSDLRVQGYREALDSAGVPQERRLERAVAPWHPENGADAMRELLDSGLEFDGVLALNDSLGIGVLRALGKAGRRVPDDVAVIGFDNIADGRFTTPSLSSVDPGRDEIAETAVAMLVERIESGSGAPRAPRLHKAAFHIVARESTGGHDEEPLRHGATGEPAEG
ncbi:LacI family DNA-binding transcriptional regulator [Cellulomonas fengjieae]|uniref:LacI family DNA-binding transcriptional regulator n=1 Tax=Cellulomonas fengjieae TaxID=2819978 RepID=A0ABS3SDU7_9CELL|nr:LacI family DNA-binding transcriptional regulator [Cellulomonas fengjieae]MBO3083135.1 LacI family DNA-binding transcriptional regulator [Cellulomonas fengjieae]MBO3102118.1 LacI family DNA-binding transcriptional regulator [Cellulomonas fengjieae]QVI65500.1 LacI family DNA-binding transcriptional regulator [Cellulomonas fengjieae]